MKKIVLRREEKLINIVVDFFTSPQLNPEYFEEIKTFLYQDSLTITRLNYKYFIDIGYLCTKDFRNFAFEKKLIEGLTHEVLNIILESLCEQLILLKLQPNTYNNPTILYAGNKNVANYYIKNNLLLNKLFGFDYIVEKYRNSVYKIEVHKGDKIDIGNGFLIKYKTQLKIVTNHHVIHNTNKIIVKNLQDEIIEIQEQIIKNESRDLAILTPNNQSLNQPLILNSSINVLDEIITIGYPPIPMSKDSYQICHKGEVNAHIESYTHQKLLIFSAKTNPGNSGSPIIDNDGTVVGIVTNQLEEKDWYLESKIPYYAGVLSSEIIEFLNEAK